jgi:hypothetical protein
MVMVVHRIASKINLLRDRLRHLQLGRRHRILDEGK